jgi:hypothetical protein
VRCIPIADIKEWTIGAANDGADRVRFQECRLRELDIDLLRDFDGMIDLDPEVTDRALNFREPKQKLNSAKVPGSPIDQDSFCSTQRVRAELRGVETDTRHPFSHEPGVLPRRQPAPVATTGKRIWPGLRPVKRRYSSIACRV